MANQKAEEVVEALTQPRVNCQAVSGLGSFIHSEAVLDDAMGTEIERAVGYDESGARECLARKIRVNRPDEPSWPDIVLGLPTG